MSIIEEIARWQKKCREFLSSLKTLFKNKMRLDVALTNGNIILSPEYSQPIKVTSTGVVINPFKLHQADQEPLRAFLLETAFDGEGIPVIQNDSWQRVLEIKQCEDRNRALLNKMSPHIPSADLAALRISLLIRDRFNRKQPVTDLLDHLHTRYGRRGQTINNLCGRDYLEQEILPYLKRKTPPKPFPEFYEELIQTSGYAVFVHTQLADLESQISDAADKNWSYGKNFVRVYGIGRGNIDRIEKAVSNLLNGKDSAFRVKKKTKSKKGKMFLELEYLR